MRLKIHTLICVSHLYCFPWMDWSWLPVAMELRNRLALYRNHILDMCFLFLLLHCLHLRKCCVPSNRFKGKLYLSKYLLYILHLNILSVDPRATFILRFQNLRTIYSSLKLSCLSNVHINYLCSYYYNHRLQNEGKIFDTHKL